MKIRAAVCSSCGIKRKNNEDNFYANGYINRNSQPECLKSFFCTKNEGVYCVCDGMGGEKYGEIASLTAVSKMIEYRGKNKDLFNQYQDHINTYVQSANNAICKLIKMKNGERMGSTVALLCINPKELAAIAANVGDSKIFLFRGNLLRKLSEDHNQAQSLVTLGVISEFEARTHKDKSKLTQHLGIFSNELIIEPYFSDTVMIEKNDLFLICSDGLTDMLSDEEITDILCVKTKNIKELCKTLVNEANNKGGTDNITVVLVKAE